jgi:hypothetical protein
VPAPGDPNSKVMRTQKRNLALNALLACLLWSAAAPALAEDDRIYWLTNYRDALRDAKQSGKPIFLEFRCEA